VSVATYPNIFRIVSDAITGTYREIVFLYLDIGNWMLIIGYLKDGENEYPIMNNQYPTDEGMGSSNSFPPRQIGR